MNQPLFFVFLCVFYVGTGGLSGALSLRSSHVKTWWHCTCRNRNDRGSLCKGWLSPNGPHLTTMVRSHLLSFWCSDRATSSAGFGENLRKIKSMTKTSLVSSFGVNHQNALVFRWPGNISPRRCTDSISLASSSSALLLSLVMQQ